jgi:alpha-galactosidase
MKFGLWMGFGQAHEDSAVVHEHPEWLVCKDGKPIVGGWGLRSLCLGYPPCRDWALAQLCRVVESFGVDWLKHDFDLLPTSDAHHHAPAASDSRIETVLGYYHIMDELRRRFPKLYLDNWTPSTGGADFGNFRRHHSTLTGDWYTPLAQRALHNGITHLFPAPRTH